MIKELLDNWYQNNLKLIWGNSFFKDFYFLEELNDLNLKHSNFSFELFLSQEEKDWFLHWRVTDYKFDVWQYDEIYICWNPNMVNDLNSKLINLWFSENKIFFEKY